MRIISVHPVPVAIVFALAYAVAGFVSFAVWAFTSVPFYVLPIGFIMGIFHLNLNIRVMRSSDLLGSTLLCLASIGCYALTGCISGGIVALCFNFVAQKTGGINAKFVTLAGEESASKREEAP